MSAQSIHQTIASQINRDLHLDVYQQGILNKTLIRLGRVEKLTDLFLTEKQQILLEALGIESNPFGTQAHPHPVNKRVEDHLLYTVLPNHLKGRIEIHYMKEQKANRVFELSKNVSEVTLRNRVNEIRDINRYGSETISSKALIGCNVETLFIHDALHYYSVDQIIECFENSPNLEHIYATTIIPQETVLNIEPVNKEFYDFKIRGETLIYIPEKDVSGAYEQPLEAREWLMVRQVVGPSFTLNIGILETYGAHHLLLITKQDVLTPLFYKAPSPNRIIVPAWFRRQMNLEVVTIDANVYNELVSYAFSIKTPSLTNIRAKLRLLTRGVKKEIMSLQLFYYLSNIVFLMVAKGVDLSTRDEADRSNIFTQIKDGYGNVMRKIMKGKTLAQVEDLILEKLEPEDVEYIWERVTITRTQKVIDYNLGKTVDSPNPLELHYQFILAVFKKRNEKLFKPYNNDSWYDPELDHYSPMEEEILEKMNLVNYKGSDTESLGTSADLVSIDGSVYDAHLLLQDELDNSSEVSYLSSNSPPSVSSIDLDSVIEQQVPQETQTHLPTLLQEQLPAPQNFEPLTVEEEQLAWDEYMAEEMENPLVEFAGVGEAPDFTQFNDGEQIGFGSEKIERPITGRANNTGRRNEGVKRITSIELRKILHSGEACGLKCLCQLHSQNCVKEFLTKLKQMDPQLLMGTNFCRLYAESTDRSFSAPLSTIDFFKFDQMMGTLTGVHTYLKQHKLWRCYNLDAEAKIFHYGNDHWTIEEKKIHTCTYKQTNYAVVEAKTEANKVTVQEAIESYVPAKDDMVNPSYIHFKEANLTLKAVNEFEEISWEDINYKNHVEPRDLATSMGETIKIHKPDRKRADHYAREIKNGTTGTLSRINMEAARGIDALVNAQSETREVEVLLRLGRGGCRKTQAIVDYLNKIEGGINCYTVVVPRTTIRADWIGKLKHNRKYCVKTFETALIQAPATTVIFDEVSMLPPGYLDTFMIRWPHVRCIILLFDILQTGFHEPHPDSLLGQYTPEHLYFAQYADSYQNYTFRSPQIVSKFLGYKSYSEVEGSITFSNLLSADAKIVACDEVTVRNIIGAGHCATTISSSQGSTVNKKLQIVVNNVTKMADEKVLNTAITRAASDIEFIFSEDIQDVDLERRYQVNPFLRALIGGQQFHFADAIPIQTPELILPDVKLEIKTKLPIVNQEEMQERLYAPLVSKWEREIEVKGVMTDQIKEENPAKQIFLKHQQKDFATWKATQEKRFRFANTHALLKKLEDPTTKFAGALLMKYFTRAMNLEEADREFDLFDFNHKQELYFKKKLTAKPLNTMANNIDRSIDDEGINAIRLFLKGQTVGKLEKMYSQAKPGQGVACFKDAALITLGPIADYLQEKIERVMPPQFWIHTKKSTRSFSEWVETYFADMDECTENDYEAYDQSQTEEALDFELRLMRFFNIPEELLEFYVFLKTHAVTNLGQLSIMRLTGEWCTFLFNTYYNIAYTALKFYDYHGKVEDMPPSAFGGDDMVVNGRLTVSRMFRKHESKYTVKSKLNVTREPVFCGWRLTPEGLYKSPKLLYAKLLTHKEEQKFVDYVIGYAIDATYLYSKFESLEKYLTDEDIEYHAALVRWVTLAGVNFEKLKEKIYPSDLLETHDALNIEYDAVKSKAMRLNKTFLSLDLKGETALQDRMKMIAAVLEDQKIFKPTDSQRKKNRQVRDFAQRLRSQLVERDFE